MKLTNLHQEVKYKTSRSGGAGGQHVNKVSTKVELLWDIQNSELFSAEQKVILFDKLKNRIAADGVLFLRCDTTRSQLKNKEIAYKRLVELVKEALKPVKKRKPSKPSRSSIEKRIKEKKIKSEKKDSRRFKPDND